MIDQPYLLVITIPYFVDSSGVRSVDPLWHKDLLAHLDVIHNLILAAPARLEEPGFPVIPIVVAPKVGSIRFQDMPPCRSTLSAIASLPKILARLWKAVGEAEIVHGNAGGWPIALGWLAIPMAKLRGKFTLTNIESAHWRLGFQKPFRPVAIARGVFYEMMARICVNISDMATFTHAGYLDSMLLPWRKHRGHVVSASWIDQKNILSRESAETLWRERLADPGRPLRAVFASSLIVNKGVVVLLDALKELDRRGVAVDVDMYGDGPLLGDCRAASDLLKQSVRLNLRGMLAYGEPFFQMLRQHDLMLVPLVSDEQPRVVYDCFSQALPVIASNTRGLLECVTDGRDGKIVPIGDAMALADAIEWASDHRETLREFGINGLDVATSLTHDQMHIMRAGLIRDAVQRKARGRRSGSVDPVTRESSPSSRPGA